MAGETMQRRGHPPQMSPRPGDWVRVRSPDEILATLDEQGRLDGMPFMPEMLAYCGKTLRVYKRAHKTCDTIEYRGLRKLKRTVHLVESRCDGSAHGGCDAACSLFWNEAWLESATAPGVSTQARRTASPPQRGPGCSMEQLSAATQRGHDAEKGPQYVCQLTELLRASQPIRKLDVRPYIEDYRSGNVDVATMLRGALYRAVAIVVRRARALGRLLGLGDAIAKPLMACYDAVQRVVPNGVPFPRRIGMIPTGQPTPYAGIGDLRPGSRVQVKPYREILATLNGNNKTRGLLFDGEHVPYCGKEYSVRSLVNQIIDERTGYMLRFKTPSIILEGVVCGGTYSDGRHFCPRAIYPYWRTIWLKPVGSSQPDTQPLPADTKPADARPQARDQADAEQILP
jgi:hypothetical protein